MSDTDDGFDEEAVRRELREKYEDEREDRETTARMSELLLQGATMTNQHCDRCGSPIFRYEGREFCPTCQHEAEQADADQSADVERQASAEQAEGQTAEPQQADRQTADQRPTDQQTADQPVADERDAASPDTHASRTADRRAPPSQTQDDRPSAADAPADQRRAAKRSGSDAGRDGGDTERGGSDAEDALESSISALARRAASADDPRTATEYLEAAREAAEALAALRHNA